LRTAQANALFDFENVERAVIKAKRAGNECDQWI